MRVKEGGGRREERGEGENVSCMQHLFLTASLPSPSRAVSSLPSYSPSKHEAKHAPRLGGGFVVKHHVNQRYATNSISATLFRELGAAVGCVTQEFVVRQDMGCGSTVGPFLAAKTGARTVDVGLAQWSMHSIRETMACADIVAGVTHLRGVMEGWGEPWVQSFLERS